MFLSTLPLPPKNKSYVDRGIVFGKFTSHYPCYDNAMNDLEVNAYNVDGNVNAVIN